MLYCILKATGYPHVIHELRDGFVEGNPFDRFLLPIFHKDCYLPQSSRNPDPKDVYETREEHDPETGLTTLLVPFRLYDEQATPPIKFIHDLSKLDTDIEFMFVYDDRELRDRFHHYQIINNGLEVKPATLMRHLTSSKTFTKKVFFCKTQAEYEKLTKEQKEVVDLFMVHFNQTPFLLD